MKTYDIEIMRLMSIVEGYSKGMPKEMNQYLLSKNVAFRIVEDAPCTKDETGCK